jgi:hypothetical protein
VKTSDQLPGAKRLPARKSLTFKVLFAVLCLLVLLVVAALVLINQDRRHYVTARDFHLLEKQVSVDGKHVLITYNLDIGALGYSRTFWAVVPAEYEKLNLSRYHLPDRFRGEGWTSDGRLIVEKWKPYYYPSKPLVELESGDQFRGVTLVVIPAEEH